MENKEQISLKEKQHNLKHNLKGNGRKGKISVDE
jgi:hypothetical protein